jgi:hypothetical protein
MARIRHKTVHQLASPSRISILVLTALLAACGGGGGGTPGPTTPAATSTNLEGVVSKGLLKGAIVKAYRVAADGAVDTSKVLGEGKTDNAGKYSFSISEDVAVLVEVTVDASTKMDDEATGATLTPTTGLSMRAAYKPVVNATNTLHITPFSEVAVAQAKSKTGGLTETNVVAANANLAAILKFNPLSDAPLFSGFKPTNAAGHAVAAVSEMAKSGDLGCTGSQAAKVNCVVSKLSSNRLDAVSRGLLQAKLDSVQVSAGLPAFLLAAPSNSTDPAVTEPVNQAKAFFATLRSNAKALDATDTSFDTELKDIQTELNSKISPINAVTEDLVRMTVNATQFWNNVKQNKPFAATNLYYANGKVAGTTGSSQLGRFYGSCSLYQDSSYEVLATSNLNSNFVACGTDGTNVYSNGQAYTGLTQMAATCVVGQVCATRYTYRLRLNPDLQDPNKATIYTMTRAAQLVGSSTTNNGVTNTLIEPRDANLNYTGRTHYGAAFPGNAAALSVSRNVSGAINGISLSGEISPTITQTGVVSPAYFVTTATQESAVGVAIDASKHAINLNLTIAEPSANTRKATISGSLATYKGASVDNTIGFAPGSFVEWATSGVAGQENDVNAGRLLGFKFGVDIATPVTTIKAFIAAGGVKPDPNNVDQIGNVEFNGQINRNGAILFDGKIVANWLNNDTYNNALPDSATNFPKISGSIVGILAIPTRPVLNLNLSGDGTVWPNGVISGQYRQGSSIVNLSSVQSRLPNTQTTTKAATKTTLESADGIKIIVTDGVNLSDVTKNGVKVGVYNNSLKRVTYLDNTFEQF